ncbi:MAG: hypothetical protein WAS49_03700 [Candidatus Dechloromonas phosphoritropha]|nr:hypothetical protein [Azonexus sp.]MBP9228934.1 hypothetical protein [Azonexus sp.]
MTVCTWNDGLIGHPRFEALFIFHVAPSSATQAELPSEHTTVSGRTTLVSTSI